MKENRDRTVCITADMLYHAQEQINLPPWHSHWHTYRQTKRTKDKTRHWAYTVQQRQCSGKPCAIWWHTICRRPGAHQVGKRAAHPHSQRHIPWNYSTRTHIEHSGINNPTTSMITNTKTTTSQFGGCNSSAPCFAWIMGRYFYTL